VDPFIRRIEREPELADLLRAARRLDERQSDAASWFDTAPGSGLEQYAAFPYETQLFYDESDDELDTGDAVHAERFRGATRALTRRLEIDELPAYFAVLAADGDSVGELISSIDTPRLHQQLSDAMVDFAAEARAITSAHQGALIYGGGDDVLAFLPLDRALACADALRGAFVLHIGPVAAGSGQVSLSVGVSIGHHSEHLQNLLGWARAAEQAAKQYTGLRPKNALAVALHTRTGGGADLTVVHSWDDDPVRTCWERWMSWHRADAIPDGAAHELSALAREFRDLEVSGAALRDEARRILLRRRGGHGGHALATTEADAILDRLGDTPPSLRLMASELIIAGRIRVAVDVAEGRRSAGGVGVGAS
jgi:CRISPR-associated protein Cmr2